MLHSGAPVPLATVSTNGDAASQQPASAPIQPLHSLAASNSVSAAIREASPVSADMTGTASPPTNVRHIATPSVVGPPRTNGDTIGHRPTNAASHLA